MRTRNSLKPLYMCVLLALSAQPAWANPVSPVVVNGQASFATTGNALTVTNTPGTIINWQGFSIGANEITRFAQQSASSAVLNRVISNNPSSILGTLQSNGRVFLVNPNGIVFGAGSTVDVAGLVATTLNLSNADFLAGRYSFTQVPGAANISNAGNITAQQGGQVYLIAPNVDNSGVITAPNGEILLAAGASVDLVNTANPNLRVSITAPAGDATNVGQLVASAGSLGLFGTVVRNSGLVSADSATLQGGTIVFKASQRAEIAGVVSATGTTGGTIQALGNQVLINAGATLDASGTNGGGTVLIGGDAHGANPNVQNAQNTYVDATATIKADATQNGNGGKVVVWSDNATQFNGNISAQGGARSGNGGWVEVSGKQWLSYAGLVNTTAAKGVTGSLLLDPVNITISTAASTGTMFWNVGTFTFSDIATGGVTTSNLNVGTLNTQLGFSNVTVNTTSISGLGVGNITVNAPIFWTTASALTLMADGSIFLNSAITAPLGSLNLFAGMGGSPTAIISQSASGSLNLPTLIVEAPGGTTLGGTTTMGGGGTFGATLLGIGTVTIPVGGVLNMTPPGFSLAAMTLVNNGTVNQQGTPAACTELFMHSATVQNNGIWNVGYGGWITDPLFGFTNPQPSTFNNAGTLNINSGLVPAGTPVSNPNAAAGTYISAVLNNTGTVNVNGTTEMVAGSTPLGGVFNLNATLTVNGVVYYPAGTTVGATATPVVIASLVSSIVSIPFDPNNQNNQAARDAAAAAAAGSTSTSATGSTSTSATGSNNPNNTNDQAAQDVAAAAAAAAGAAATETASLPICQ